MNFKNNCCRAQKSELIPKFNCTTLLEYLYCMYNNTKPKSVPKGVTIMYFHPFETLAKFPIF